MMKVVRAKYVAISLVCVISFGMMAWVANRIRSVSVEVPDHCASINLRAQSGIVRLLENTAYHTSGLYLRMSPSSNLTIGFDGAPCDNCIKKLATVRSFDTLLIRHCQEVELILNKLKNSTITNVIIVDSALPRNLLPLLASITNLHRVQLMTCSLPDRFAGEPSCRISLDLLNLSGTPINDNGMSHMLSYYNPKEIDISGTRITKVGGPEWVNVEELRMNCVTLAEARLNGFLNLSSLSMGGTRAPKAFFEQLGALSGLKSLYLCEVEIGDEIFPAVFSLPHLKVLRLEKTKVTVEALNEFRHARPEVMVTF